MKDISNNRQPSFLLMKIDENGTKYWRLNYNVIQKTDEESNPYFECDFVPQNGGLQAEEPSVELFHGELVRFGLTEEQISKI